MVNKYPDSQLVQFCGIFGRSKVGIFGSKLWFLSLSRQYLQEYVETDLHSYSHKFYTTWNALHFILTTIHTFYFINLNFGAGYGGRPWAELPEFKFRQGVEISLFSTISKPSMDPAHPATYPMCARGTFLWYKSGRGLKVTTHFHLVPRSRFAELHKHSPSYLMA
jgi:hypothetical protein